MSELEAELELLRSALEERGAQLSDVIKEENQRKDAELQVEHYVLDCCCLLFTFSENGFLF